ncbi:hypothetical protein PT277_05385 [Acetobacteraceae bacterium ESL0709]|nr:hypothetical protein [Acetobacteraceae bacterium ESL0697]MDF7678129.1 hypothetical protein [Acetobacteraceae bacterium ESL0709]
MKLPTLFLLGASCFLTACGSNQAHYVRAHKTWQWHNLWEAGVIRNDEHDLVIGLLDDDGYIYDPLRNRLGRIETVGTIKRRKAVLGYIRNSLHVYDTHHQLTGYVDKKGYIFDQNNNLNGKLYEHDFSSSTINFAKRPTIKSKGVFRGGILEYSDEVYDIDNKKVGIITYIPQETDYQAIPVSHPDDRMIVRSRPYGAILLLDYDRAAMRHKDQRDKYAYVCKFAYVENKREVYDDQKKLIGYMDQRDGFGDRDVYNLKHQRVGFVSYGGTDTSYTDINLYDTRDRAVGRIPYGFEDFGARMLLEDPNNEHVPWDGFEECDGGTLDQDHNLLDENEDRVGRVDQNLNVLDLQDRIVGHIGPDGALFDENNKLIAKRIGTKGDAGEVYKGTLTRFEEAHKILKTYQDRQREAADQKIREEKAQEAKLQEEKERQERANVAKQAQSGKSARKDHENGKNPTGK